jgi:hypothetical protein
MGVNSAITRGEEGDTNFAFAIAESELAAFLRANRQAFNAVDIPCMSLEARLSADEAADSAAREAADASRRDSAARDQASRQQAVEAARLNAQRASENVMAIAALLLVLGALTVGGGGLLYTRGRQREAIWAGSAGGVLIVAAIITFLVRPSEEPMLPPGFAVPVATPVPAAARPLGKMVCKFQPDRSRVTVSATADVTLDWGQDGCVNGKTQYADDNGKWTRVLVPNDEQTVSVLQFDPETRTYTAYRYFLSAAQMDAARKLRAQSPLKQCSADAGARNNLMVQQQSIRAALPTTYSEKLVYSCTATP